MTWSEWLSVFGNIAAILTAIGAAIAYGKFKYDYSAQVRRLENLLKPKDGGKYGTIFLVDAAAELGITELETLNAASRSKKVQKIVSPAMQGFPSRIFLRYRAKDL